MEILLVTHKQEATATHFHVFSEYRCWSLVLETLVPFKVAWYFANPFRMADFTLRLYTGWFCR